MNKKLILLLSLPLLLCSCTHEEVEEKEFSGQTLNIYNSTDYIANGEDDSRDLLSEFEDLYGCKVNYYTYDVNETMYNQFKLQKEGTYDLINTSEYMIQKMAKEGLIEKFDNFEEAIPNYDTYGSKILRSKLENMKVYDNETGEYKGNLDEYAVGYMWGTLGLTYDPTVNDGQIEEDIKTWDILWNENYANMASIKNSMRDAYAVGLMHYFGSKEDYKQIRQDYLDNPNETTSKRYNDYIQEIFDLKTDDSEESKKENAEKIAIVKDELISVKDNIFGFETDAGKSDIVEGSKIKINLAWSGDAVFSMWTALEENDKELKYYVPEDGANIWYDCWFLPKGGKKDLAQKFLDFISSPDAAADNMDFIGYTPFITGTEMYHYTALTYGAQLFTEGTEYTAYDEEEDVMDLVIYDDKLYLCINDTDGEIVPTNSDYFECLEIEDPQDIDMEYQDMCSFEGKIYQCYEDSASNIDELEEVEPYDLTHIYDNITGHDEVIYPWAGYENMLECQYPSKDIITRCGIMNDFGVYNADVIIMWGQIKAYTNMTPYYVFLAVVVLGILSFSVISITKKKVSARNKRNKAKEG